MTSARVLICCSPNMSFRRSAFPGNFRKFMEISGGRRSAVGGRLRSAVGLSGYLRLTSAVGQISLEISGLVVSFEGSDFQKNV